MTERKKEIQLKGWDRIYLSPEDYQYYDLFKPHESMAKVAAYFYNQGVVNVLDIGCGTGSNLFSLLNEGFNLTGVDQSPQSIAIVKKISEQAKKEVVVLQAKFQNLPFPDSSFDALISVQTLNHGYEDDVKRGISEIERVLKPQGLIFITVPGRIANRETRYCLVKTARKVDERVYLPEKGEEAGIPHFIYNMDILRMHYQNFKLIETWKDNKDYYCFLGRKK